MNILRNNGFQLLEQTLDASALRQKVTANNIANVDTPFFKRSDVTFEEVLQEQLSQTSMQGKRTHPKHFAIGAMNAELSPQIVEDRQSVMNNNMNNVDIDSEMSLMAKNQLRYNTVIQQVTHEIRNLRTAIKGGGSA